jgi:hypothetical protein
MSDTAAKYQLTQTDHAWQAFENNLPGRDQER